jgi:predicted TIM-barrel fold metal-dependent hydrolase
MSLTCVDVCSDDGVNRPEQRNSLIPSFRGEVRALVEEIGADRVLFGSDWPHAAGLTEPLQFEKEIASLDAATRTWIMRDNSAALLGR